MKEWKEQSFYTNPETIKQEVRGQEQIFAAVSLKQIVKLKSFAVPLAKVIAALWSDDSKDRGHIDRRFVAKNAPPIITTQGASVPSSDTEVIDEPIKEGLAKVRHEQKMAAVNEFLDKFTDDKAISMLGEVVMDSMVELFDREKRNTWPPVDEFLGRTPFPAFMDMLIGVAKANKGKLGPLAEKAGVNSTALAAAVRAKVEEYLPKETTQQAG